MKISVAGAGFDELVTSTCFAELGQMATGIHIHSKGMIEIDLVLCTKSMNPDGTNNLIQQNIERRKPPNSEAKVIKN